ncbi:ABC transporter permease [Hominenteromicrobium sp.]|nr:ABC-2 family transporter protein [Candidatus Ruminococcus gallistercoris]
MIYRAATLSSVASTLLSFAIQICLWYALLGTGLQDGTRFTDMVLYVLVNMFVSTLTRANIATTIEAAVVDGSIAMEILRPISYKYYLLSSIFGRNAFSVVTNVLPVVVIGAFFLGGAQLPGAGGAAAFAVSLVLGVLLMFELTYTFGLLAFRIQRCWFLNWYVSALTTFFGGTAVPLWFYPEVLQAVSYALPFRYVAFEPVNLLLGRTPAGDAWMPILCALAWLLALGLLGRLMWRSAVRGLTVNGG